MRYHTCRKLLPALLVLVPAAVVGWTGWWVLAVSVVVLLTLLFGRGRCVVRKRWDVVATATALLAGIVGVSGAGLAITTMGSLPPYDSRVALGWTALALAAAATVLGLSSPARAAVSGLAMALAGLMGAVAISFFYIDTYYFAAVPIWVLAAAFRLGGQDHGTRALTTAGVDCRVDPVSTQRAALSRTSAEAHDGSRTTGP